MKNKKKAIKNKQSKPEKVIAAEISSKKINEKQILWFRNLSTKLRCSVNLINGLLIIVAWAVIMIFLVVIFVFSKTTDEFYNYNDSFNVSSSVSKNDKVQTCEFYHPLTGECSYWEKISEEKAETMENIQENKVELADQRVFTVMVENHPDARPQSGLAAAQVVYEALVEGGITRFLLIFDNLQAGDISIGPVRSARAYYLWFAYELDNALYGHVGGSPEALSYIQNKGINDCDEFYYGSTVYERISSRWAPHNTYTTVADLEVCNDGATMGRLTEIAPWKFMEEGTDNIISSPVVSEINVAYSDNTYLAKWQYNQEEKLYYRFYANGQPNIDKGTNQQIAASNIVVVVMPSRAIDDYGRLSMDSLGEGDLIVYRKGEKISGKWTKAEKESRLKFLDEHGEEIALMPGKTWIQVVPNLNILIEE